MQRLKTCVVAVVLSVALTVPVAAAPSAQGTAWWNPSYMVSKTVDVLVGWWTATMTSWSTGYLGAVGSR